MPEHEINETSDCDEPVIDITKGMFIYLIDISNKKPSKIASRFKPPISFHEIKFIEMKSNDIIVKSKEFQALSAFIYLYTPQTDENFTVIEIFNFNSSEDFILSKFSELINDIGLKDFLKKKFKELNDEEKLKVLIASEIMAEKKVLIVDPPFDDQDKTGKYLFDNLIVKLKWISEKYKLTILFKKKYFRENDFNKLERVVISQDSSLLFYGNEEELHEEIKNNDDFLNHKCSLPELLQILTSDEDERKKGQKYKFYMNFFTINKDKKIFLQSDIYSNEDINTMSETLKIQDVKNLILRDFKRDKKSTKSIFYKYFLFCLVFPVCISLIGLVFQKMIVKSRIGESSDLPEKSSISYHDNYFFVIQNVILMNLIVSFYGSGIICFSSFLYFYEFSQRTYETTNGKYSKKSYILSFYVRCLFFGFTSCSLLLFICNFFMPSLESFTNTLITLLLIPVQVVTTTSIFLMINNGRMFIILPFIIYSLLSHQPFTKKYTIFTNQNSEKSTFVQKLKRMAFSIVLLPFVYWKVFTSYIYGKHLCKKIFSPNVDEINRAIEKLKNDPLVTKFCVLGDRSIPLDISGYICLGILLAIVIFFFMKLNMR